MRTEYNLIRRLAKPVGIGLTLLTLATASGCASILIPRYPGETAEEYKARLDKPHDSKAYPPTSVDNAVGHAIRDLFKKSPKKEEDK